MLCAAARLFAMTNSGGKTKPAEMFLKNPDYSKFDDKGMPTHDAKGEPVAKSKLKKLAKQFKAQDKAHKKYLKSLE